MNITRIPFPAALRRSAMMGLWCLPIGLGAGAWLSWHNLDSGYSGMLVAAPLGAFLTGALCWLLLQWRRPVPGKWRGFIAGALAGALGHWFCWYILILIQNLRYVFLGEVSSLGEPPMTPIEGLWGAAVFCFFSIVIMGWATIPTGGVIGFVLGLRQGRKAEAAANPQ